MKKHWRGYDIDRFFFRARESSNPIAFIQKGLQGDRYITKVTRVEEDDPIGMANWIECNIYGVPRPKREKKSIESIADILAKQKDGRDIVENLSKKYAV